MKILRRLAIRADVRARVDSMDVLRGFALFGIFVMNIQAMAMPAAAYFNPTVYGDFGGGNFLAYAAAYLLCSDKFITVFSLLFGAGVVLSFQGVSPPSDARRQHYGRMAALAVIGLLHGFLLWFGDILFSYAVAGSLAFLFRTLSPRKLVVTALALYAVTTVISLVFGLNPQLLPPDLEQEAWAPTAQAVQSELATYQGRWLGQFPLRAETAAIAYSAGMAFDYLWRTLGLMLLGMALAKGGVFEGTLPASFYRRLIAAGGLVGLPLSAAALWQNVDRGWPWPLSMFVIEQLNYWGSLLVALAYLSAWVLVCRRWPTAAWTRPLAAAGRLSLSNYLLQTLVGTALFYGHGFGLFGQVNRATLWGVAAAVYAGQLAASWLYLRRLHTGPAEWLWRWLAYGAAPRRAPSAVSEAA